MENGTIEYILARPSTRSDSKWGEYSPEIKMGINLEIDGEHIDIALVITDYSEKNTDLHDYERHWAEEYDGYLTNHSLACVNLAEDFWNTFKNNECIIYLWPKGLSSFVRKMLRKSSSQEYPMNLSHEKDEPVIVTCDAEGYPIYGASRIYRYGKFTVELFLCSDNHGYIYEPTDSEVAKQYPRLINVLEKLKNGLRLDLSNDSEKTYLCRVSSQK